MLTSTFLISSDEIKKGIDVYFVLFVAEPDRLLVIVVDLDRVTETVADRVAI